jgi:hypothetical protein
MQKQLLRGHTIIKARPTRPIVKRIKWQLEGINESKVNVWNHPQVSNRRMTLTLRSATPQPPTFTRLPQARTRDICQSRCSGTMMRGKGVGVAHARTQM